MQKIRLDMLLVEKGHFNSREKARNTIMAGLVYIDNQKIDKPGTKVNTESEILIKGNSLPFVSRGGLKIEKALKEFKIDVNRKICIDIGASAGGFTDCMLQHGAKHVYSIDVGYGQLDWKLRQDSRVTVMERTNIRNVKPSDLKEPGEFAAADVSFISLKLVIPVLKTLLLPGAEMVVLIKPQFEAGREKVGKKGVVRDISVHKEVAENIISFSIQEGLSVLNFSYSPIKGPEGNIEYLLHLKNNGLAKQHIRQEEIERIIKESHNL